MEEIGVDMGDEFPKPLTDEVVRAADIVITMGCGDGDRSIRASATRTGCSTIPRVRIWTRCDGSGTRSTRAYECWSANCSTRDVAALVTPRCSGAEA